MKFWRYMVLLCAFLVLAQAALAASPAPSKPYIGILPVYDATGQAHGELFAQHLTYMIWDELRGSNVEAVLLNPGGAYSPFSPEYFLDYARSAGVDGVIVVTLLRTEKPKSGSMATLQVELKLINVADGKASAATTHNVQIDKKYIDKLETSHVGAWAVLDSAAYASTHWNYGTPAGGPSRVYEKQPIGKAARDMARSIRGEVLRDVPGAISGTSAPVPIASGGSCPVEFTVVYPTKNNAISKTYQLVVNGREESLGIKDGVAKLTLPGGITVMHVVINQAPYKLTAQKLYQLNTYVDCSRPRNLALEVGAAGEGLLKWQ